jgi:hypothetical protein
MIRVTQSGQAYRAPPPWRVRDNGRIVAASTNRLHSGHRLVFDGEGSEKEISEFECLQLR